MLPGGLQSLPAARLTLQRSAPKLFLSEMCFCTRKSAHLWEAMFGCHFIDPWLTVARVKISKHIFFTLPCTQHWLVESEPRLRAPCGGLPSRDRLSWKSNRILIPAWTCRHWSNVNIVAEHSLIIYPATENFSTAFIALLSIIHQPVRGTISAKSGI